MKLVLWIFVLCAAIVVISAAENNSTESSWKWFKTLHKRKFKSWAQEIMHKLKFITRLGAIREHNKLFKAGKVLFKRAVNKFSDMSNADFIKQYNGFRMDFAPDVSLGRSTLLPLVKESGEPPKSFDWREKGVITPIQHQYQCASCWSFASAAALEAHERILNNRTVGLSEQNLLDCAKSFKDAGCSGGHPVYAFLWVQNHSGLNYRYYYPYEEAKKACRHNERHDGVKAKGFVRFTDKDEELLKHVVAKIGPVAVAIDADVPTFQDYDEGVYYSDDCNAEKLSHAVLIVGYGTEDGQDYWLIKNSYGEGWGINGYVKLARNRGNHCGVSSDASYPVL